MAEMDPGGAFAEESSGGLGGRLVSVEEALNDRKKRKAQREEERKSTTRAYEKVQVQRKEEEDALTRARVNAVRLRSEGGAYLGTIEGKPFTLANPGGGPDLLEDATFTLVRGKRYGLIGRNGKGKSTLLRSLASRSVGDIPAAVTVHYVSQEVQLDDASLEQTPLQIVLQADLERSLLLAEAAQLQNKEGAADQVSPSTTSRPDHFAGSADGHPTGGCSRPVHCVRALAARGIAFTALYLTGMALTGMPPSNRHASTRS